MSDPQGMQYEFEHDEGTDTYTIKGVEIFEEGNWNGEPYTAQDMTEIVRADEALHDLIRPRLKIGHGEKKEGDDTGEPALGWMSKFVLKGTKLLADLARVPREMFEAIQRGSYTRQSVELRLNFKHPQTGERFPMVIDALAFLGAKLPAVATLKPLAAFDVGGSGVWLTKDTGKEPGADAGEKSPTQTFEATGETTPPKKAQGGDMDDRELKAAQEEAARKTEEAEAAIAKAKTASEAADEREKRLHASKIDGMADRLLEAQKASPGELETFKLVAAGTDDAKELTFGEKDKGTALDGLFKSWMGRPAQKKKTGGSEPSPENDKEEPDRKLFSLIEKRAKELAEERGGDAFRYFAEAAGEIDGDHQTTVEAYRKKFAGSAPSDVVANAYVIKEGE